MKLQLPTVTLVMVESLPGHHQLARLAVQDCLDAADFGDVLIMADQFNELRFPGAKHVLVQNWPEKIGYSRCLWFQMPLYVKTEHVMIIQWDSWITHPQLWKPEFLDYDYIGSPWKFKELNVGNSGFSLRSKRLMDCIIKNKERFPLNTDSEDYMLSRIYQPTLKKYFGFEWAPEDLAFQFAVETNTPKGWRNSFGFHGIFAWPYMLEKDRLIERGKLAAKSKYINTVVYDTGKTMLDEMLLRCPWLTFFIERV